MPRREQMRPASNEQAPDPAHSYERAKPQRESGQGRLDNNISTPTNRADKGKQAVKNRQAPRQVNAQDVTDARQSSAPKQPDHSMHDEEPLGWDQALTEATDPRRKGHPRKEGKGGLK
jgi:hypothetical protein